MKPSKAENRLRLLQHVDIIKDCQIMRKMERNDLELFRIVATLIDGSKLYLSERWISDRRIRYSYYWVKAGEVIAGWNDAPHHRDLPTFPYHAHLKEETRPIAWGPADIKNVTDFIRKRLKI